MPNVNIAKAIAMLSAAYSNFVVNDATPAVFEAILGDLDADALNAAVLKCLSEPRAFAPSPGEIRQAVLLLNAKAAGIPDAFQAYEEVTNMPATMESAQVIVESGQNVIVYSPLKFSHPIVEAVARMLGWPERFPNPDTSMAGVDRAQFVKAYDTEVSRLMGDAGRLPMLNEYIESRRDLRGGSPLLTGAVRQLEGKGAG